MLFMALPEWISSPFKTRYEVIARFQSRDPMTEVMSITNSDQRDVGLILHFLFVESKAFCFILFLGEKD